MLRASSSSMKSNHGLSSQVSFMRMGSMMPDGRFDPNINVQPEPIIITKELEDFMKVLATLQENQLQISLKIQKEKKESIIVDESIEKARKELDKLRQKTRNGDINRVDQIQTRKLISKLEYQLQTMNTKLSLSKQENIDLKQKIDNLRRDKITQLKIMHELENNYAECLRSIQSMQKETMLLNERNHRIKMSLAGLKNKMINDMEDFSNQLEVAQENIHECQTNMLNIIHDRMKTTVNSIEESKVFLKGLEKISNKSIVPSEIFIPVGYEEEVMELLQQVNLPSIHELIQQVQSAEETMFVVYNKIQDQNREFEQLESENNAIEHKLTSQNAERIENESKNNQRKQDIESQIQLLQKQITKHDQEYQEKNEKLKTISDALMKMLKHVANEEDSMDVHLLTTGLTDRNVDEFLGLIEQRLDHVIQLSKAALHESLNKDDFINIPNIDRVGILQVPNLPSLASTDDHFIMSNDMNNDNYNIMDSTSDLTSGNTFPVNINILKEVMAKKIEASMNAQINPLDNINTSPMKGGNSHGMYRNNNSNRTSHRQLRNQISSSKFSVQSSMKSLHSNH